MFIIVRQQLAIAMSFTVHHVRISPGIDIITAMGIADTSDNESLIFWSF